MSLNLRVQSLTNNTDPIDGSYSVTHEFDVPNDELLQSKGQLFLTVNLTANENFDLKAAIALFIDNIRDSYYNSNEDTPLNSIESSLKKATTILMTFKSKDEKETLSSLESGFKINFVSALVWNKVLYVSFIGNPAAYLIRETGTRDLGTNNDPNTLWTNSSLLNNDDVIIIGTNNFRDNFPPEEIITNLNGITKTINEKPDSTDIAGIVIKVTSDTEINSKTLQDKVKNITLKGFISNSIWKTKEKFIKSEKLSDKFKFSQSKKSAPISTIGSITATETNNELASNGIQKSKPRRLSKTYKGSKKRSRSIVGISIFLISGFLVYYLILSNSNNEESPTLNDITTQISVLGEKDGDSQNIEASKELHQKILNSQDLDKDLVVSAFSTITDNNIAIIDTETETLDIYNYDNKENQEILSNISNFSSIECDDKYCYIYENDTLIITDPESPQKVDRYLISDIGQVTDIYPYRDKLYLLTPGTIYAFTLKTTEPKEWLNEDLELNNAKSLAIDGNIYVIEGKDINKYYDGNLVEDYNLDESYLLNPIQIDISDKMIYVLDDIKRSVIVFDKNSGEFFEEILLAEQSDFDIPSEFSITEDKEFKIMFKKGNDLYLVGGDENANAEQE